MPGCCVTPNDSTCFAAVGSPSRVRIASARSTSDLVRGVTSSARVSSTILSAAFLARSMSGTDKASKASRKCRSLLRLSASSKYGRCCQPVVATSMSSEFSNGRAVSKSSFSRAAVPCDFRLLTLRELQHILTAAGEAIEWEGADLPALVSWLEAEGVAEPLTVDTTPVAVKRLVDCIETSGRHLYPQVVRAKSQTRPPGKNKVVVDVERVWRLPARDLQLECSGTKSLTIGGHYFLKATFKERSDPTYREAREGVVTFHEAATFGPPPSSSKYYLLVEGDHDEFVFRTLMDHFMPYWRARVVVQAGGGDSLAEVWHELRRGGHEIMVVADADKRGRWDHMSPCWMQPDLEGVDPGALAEAVGRLWGHSVGRVDESTIGRILLLPPAGSTVVKLSSYFRATTRTFTFPEENEMKKQLRSEIARIWIQKKPLPTAIVAVLLGVAQHAFGLRARAASVPAAS